MNFIKLHRSEGAEGAGEEVLVNTDTVFLFREGWEEHTGHRAAVFTDNGVVFVAETIDEIEALLNPKHGQKRCDETIRDFLTTMAAYATAMHNEHEDCDTCPLCDVNIPCWIRSADPEDVEAVIERYEALKGKENNK